jgi:NAD(P)-dependent dehydrogenase (short-subunit alcohol dehydrogenase family)
MKKGRIDMQDRGDQRAAVVTGGGQGIGLGIAETLAREGWAVVLAEVDAEAGREAEDRVQGGVFVETDVSSEPSVRRLARTVADRFGRLDGLINNAGIASPLTGPPEELGLAQWNQIISVNLTGYFLTARHLIPLLRASRGAIVNIASTRAMMSEPHTEAYSASKGGVVALTHALAASLAPDVRVNCISPGWISVDDWQKKSQRQDPDLRPIDHRQHWSGRVGRPEDVAGLTAYLLSPAARFINGQNLVMDGGMTRKMIYEE